MTSDKFNDSIRHLLNEGRISHVITTLRHKAEKALEVHPDMVMVLRQLDTIEDTYTRLRNFMLDGNNDPDRDKVYASICESLQNVGRNYLFIFNENRNDPYFEQYRLTKIRPISLQQLSLDLQTTNYRLQMAHETESDPSPFERGLEIITDHIFAKVWTLPPWAAADRLLAASLLASAEVTFEIKSQIVSALMLSLLKFYDPGKFLILLTAYEESGEERLSARTLTAIILVLARWGVSALASADVASALETLQDSLLTYTRTKEVVMTLIRTRDTDRVSREINDAINSTMKEISPEILEKLQRDGLAVDASETGINPEWEKLMLNSKIEEKMKAINDMQLEGMDVMMQTFANLKSFPFFSNVAHWFLPFTTTHSMVKPLFEKFNEKGFNTMADATEMCGGDRFSFVMGILRMPTDKQNLLAANISNALETLQDQISDRDNVKRRSVFSSEVLSFCRDIYRFAKLYHQKKDFYNPFEEPLDFLGIPMVSALLANDEIILDAANFYFRHGYYALALNLYEKAAAGGEANRQIYEKIGYSYQMAGDFVNALLSYEKADLFSTDVDKSSAWLIKKLAFNNKALGHYEAAAEYYRRLLKRNPDDINAEFHLGTVLLRSGKIAEGRELISKVHYLAPDLKSATRLYTRLKAHDAFVAKKYREALNLYEEARGESQKSDYNTDIILEMQLIHPEADLTALRILLEE